MAEEFGALKLVSYRDGTENIASEQLTPEPVSLGLPWRDGV
jgi:hypothetical protein